MNQVILNLWQGKGILPTINQTSYDVGNETIQKTEVLKSNLCDYNDVEILVSVQIAFKKFTPFTKCITKINETTIHDAEYLDEVMPK